MSEAQPGHDLHPFSCSNTAVDIDTSRVEIDCLPSGQVQCHDGHELKFLFQMITRVIFLGGWGNLIGFE